MMFLGDTSAEFARRKGSKDKVKRKRLPRTRADHGKIAGTIIGLNLGGAIAGGMIARKLFKTHAFPRMSGASPLAKGAALGGVGIAGGLAGGEVGGKLARKAVDGMYPGYNDEWDRKYGLGKYKNKRKKK